MLAVSVSLFPAARAMPPTTGPSAARQAMVPLQQAAHRVYLPLVTVSGTEPPPVPGPTDQELIAGALQAGRIDYATSLLYRAYALFGDDRLPREFWGSDSGGEDNGIFLHSHVLSATLATDVQRQLRPFLVRPTHPDSVYHQSSSSLLARTVGSLQMD